MRRLLAALVVVVGALVLEAGPAHACSCAGTTDTEALMRADVALVGRAVSTAFWDRDPYSSSDPTTWTFEVDRVYKGEVGATHRTRSVRGGASCGLELTLGRRALVFVRDGEANLCNGTRAITAATPVAVALGEGSTPGTGTTGYDGDGGDGGFPVVFVGGLAAAAAVTVTVAIYLVVRPNPR